MRYQYLLVDNDNTLMDFSAAEDAALKDCLSALGLPSDDETRALYSRINDGWWKALERGEVRREEIGAGRFRDLLKALDRQDVAPEVASLEYQNRLSCHAELMPGAMEFMTALQGRMKISLVTNGNSAIQRGRLSRCAFTPLLDDVVISAELGVSKPDPRLVQIALERLGCTDPAQAVFLGDSLTADIAAARAAGIDSIWLCPGEGESTEPTYTVRSLQEALQLLERG